MATLTLDTHDFIKRLTAAGMEEGQAEALVTAFKNASLENMATKEDISDLRVDIRDLKADLLKWMITMMLGQVVAFAAIVAWITG